MTWRAPSALTPLPAQGTCRRDDLSTAQHGEGGQQAAGDSAGSVDKERSPARMLSASPRTCLAMIAGTGKAAAAPQLAPGGLRASSPAGAISRGAQGPLVSQRHRMRHHRIAGRPVTDRLVRCQHRAGCLNAQRHRRPATHIPAAGADELIPAGHAGRPHLEQRLVAGQPPRLAHLDHLNPGTHPPHPRYLHLLPLSLLLQAARQPLPGRPAS
jgi:hypothetical protein